MPIQNSLFPLEDIVFHCFHDESGNYVPHSSMLKDRWLFHGVLLVPTDKKDALIQELSKVREQTNYFNEVHYVKLRKSRGPIANCLKGWLNAYLSYSENCYFYCLAIDTQSRAFKHENFSEIHHCYNYFARTAIVSAIAWSLAQYWNQRLRLQIFSDPKRRPPNDNFVSYIPKTVEKSIRDKRAKKAKYPNLLVDPKVTFIGSDPRKIEKGQERDCELIQLVDLLTSGVAQAIRSSSNQQGKIHLGLLLADWIEDSRRLPWLQRKDLHRRFSVSCFPDKNGDFYDPKLPIREKETNRTIKFDI